MLYLAQKCTTGTYHLYELYGPYASRGAHSTCCGENILFHTGMDSDRAMGMFLPNVYARVRPHLKSRFCKRCVAKWAKKSNQSKVIAMITDLPTEKPMEKPVPWKTERSYPSRYMPGAFVDGDLDFDTRRIVDTYEEAVDIAQKEPDPDGYEQIIIELRVVSVGRRTLQFTLV